MTTDTNIAELYKFYEELPREALVLLRSAFILDRDAGAAPEFCQRRIDLITRILEKRLIGERA